MILQQIIERLYAAAPGTVDADDIEQAILQLKDALNGGTVRAAECQAGVWRANAWVKRGILLAFKTGILVRSGQERTGQFYDKHTMALKSISLADNIRVVPGGSAVRDGSYLAPGVVIMPPAYVNIGAYVDADTLIDSHALVGSCAQIGKRVHLSAGAQIGGVLEPVGSVPVIVEDDVFVGGNTGIYEGTIVRRRAVIGAGVILTGSTPVYDLPGQCIHKRSKDGPLEIPAGAVVVAGNRRIEHSFADEHKLSLYAPVIIKYRDDKTDASTALEESLR